MKSMFAGVSKKESKWIWILIIWLLFVSGPGMVLFDTGTFFGPFPVLYLFLLVGWAGAIFIGYQICFKQKFTDIDLIADKITEEQQREIEAGRK